MHNFLKGVAITIAGSALLLLGALLLLTISSPSGNVGDEGIIAIPLLLILVFATPVGFVTALAYLIAKRPQGKDILLPVAVLGAPALMALSMYGYSEFKRNQGVISANGAIERVKLCEIKSMVGDNHKRYKLEFYDREAKSAWISTADQAEVYNEILRSKEYCKN